MVEMNEQNTAKVLLRRSQPIESLRENQVDRYAKLEELVARPKFDTKLAYPDGATKESRRNIIAKGWLYIQKRYLNRNRNWYFFFLI